MLHPAKDIREYPYRRIVSESLLHTDKAFTNAKLFVPHKTVAVPILPKNGKEQLVAAKNPYRISNGIAIRFIHFRSASLFKKVASKKSYFGHFSRFPTLIFPPSGSPAHAVDSIVLIHSPVHPQIACLLIIANSQAKKARFSLLAIQKFLL